MTNKSKVIVFHATLVLFVLFLVGGCGSSNSEGTNGVVISYKGATTPAVVTEDNAEILAVDGFAGSTMAAYISIPTKKQFSSDRPITAKVGTHPAFLFAQRLKQSIRKIDITHAFKRDRTNASGRTIRYQIPGDAGGTADFSFIINDSTGSFSGTIVYSDYSSMGIVINGKADVTGSMSVDGGTVSTLAMSLTSLTIDFNDSIISLIGRLSWKFNDVSYAETLSMDLTITDHETEKTYWYNNYKILTAYSSSTSNQTMSGRYYDHDYGYVDVSTCLSISSSMGYGWPEGGCLMFNGSLNTWVMLTFFEDSYQIEADTDGDGQSDWDCLYNVDDPNSTNTPPLAEAGPDQNVTQWATVYLDGGGSSDEDNDTLSYSWSMISSPGNAYTPLADADSAAPSFTAESAGTYVLGLVVYDGYTISEEDTVSIIVSPITPLFPDAVSETWHTGIFGTSIGQAGLYATDLDDDGAIEIIASASAGGFGSNTFWYVVKIKHPGTYEQVWRSPDYGVTLARLSLADVDNDGQQEIVAALQDGTVKMYNGTTFEEIRRLSVSSPLADDAVEDLDRDGTMELVTTDGIGLFVYNAETGDLKWTVGSGGGDVLALGNVDMDANLEIVTSSYGGSGYVVNGLTGDVKWEYVNSFGAIFRLCDLTNDGIKEIIGASAWYKITVFDSVLEAPSWEISTGLDINSIVVTDTNGDGVPEIVYGDGQWGSIHAIDSDTRTEIWSMSNPEHGVSGIAVCDVDVDGSPEVIWGAGGSSSGADYLFVGDAATDTIEWQSLDVYGLSSLDTGDVDDDGNDEIVMITEESNSGYEEGIIHIFDGRTHDLTYREAIGTMDWMGENRNVKIGDVDGDGQTEFVFSTANIYDGVIQVRDGATQTLEMQSAGYNGNFFSAIAIGDVDNDGNVEIVAGMGREHTGADGVYVVVFNGSTLAEKWRSADLGIYWGAVYDIKLADLDHDGHQDIIASMDGNRMIIYDGLTQSLKRMIDTPALALDVTDVDNDGTLDLLVGGTGHNIDVYDGVTLSLKKSVFTFNTTSVTTLKVSDLDDNGSKEWIVGGNGFLSILQGPDQNHGLIWQSDYLGNIAGRNNHIGVCDLDRNGLTDIIIGSKSDIVQFEFTGME